MTVFIPAQCSEREGGGWEDCTWATGVMLQNAAHGANVAPSTRQEYEALRVAGGDGPAEKPGDGSNNAQLVAGMQKRYGWSPRRVGPPGAVKAPWSAILAGLAKPGDCAGIQGSMGAFGDPHWRRWDPGFGGGHEAFVERLDTTDRVWWMNPQAPNTYAGEWMGLVTLRTFYDGFTGGAVFAHVGQQAPTHVRIAHNAIVRAYRLGPEGADGIRCIAKVGGHYGVDERWTGPTTTFAAVKLAARRTCDKRSGARTAVPTEGPYKDRCIRVGAAGVTAT